MSKLLSDATEAELESQLKARKKSRCNNPVGTWTIKTEGDCEGKSIKTIATETGHVGDLLLKYAATAYYTLWAELVTGAVDSLYTTPNTASVAASTFPLEPALDRLTTVTNVVSVDEIIQIRKFLGEEFEVVRGIMFRSVVISKRLPSWARTT